MTEYSGSKIKFQPELWNCKGCPKIINDLSYHKGKKREWCSDDCRRKNKRRLKRLNISHFESKIACI